MDGWHLETIASCGMEIVGSIILDNLGTPHVSFNSCGANLLTYAYRDSGTWIEESVDNLPYAGYFSSIDIDSLGMPHIGYSLAGLLDVRYAYLDSTGWHTETIPGEWAGNITIKMDSLDYPHLAYYDWNHQNLRYATKALAPIKGLTAENDSPTELEQSALFTATIASGDLVNYTWDFGDGQTGEGRITTHIYPQVGTYTATITAENARNVMTATTTVEIVDVPISGLIATNGSPVLVGETTTLSATVSSGSNVTFTWDFGDGQTGVGALTTHTYDVPGEYTARVTASNGIGIQETSTQVIILPRKIYLPLVER